MIRWGSRTWQAWVAYWDEREPPVVLGLVRILFAACVVADFATIGRLGLVHPLMTVAEVGGLSDALLRDSIPLYHRLLPGLVESGWILWGVLLASSLTLLLGLYTRVSAAVLLVAWAQYASLEPYGDRGVDMLCRLVLAVLVFAPADRWGSVDAWRRTGSVWGSGAPEPSWARKLLVGQLVLVYFTAGITKVGVTWWPWGHASALYYALQDPAVAAFDFGFLRQMAWFRVAQVGALTTLLYQISYPTVLLLMWWRRHPGRGGPIAAFCSRYRLELLWIGAGALFHVVLATVMNLGTFPWVMLALYPVWFSATEWQEIGRGVRNLLLACIVGASPDGQGGWRRRSR